MCGSCRRACYISAAIERPFSVSSCDEHGQCRHGLASGAHFGRVVHSPRHRKTVGVSDGNSADCVRG